MKLVDYIKSEIKFFTNIEKIFYPIVIFVIFIISIITKDSKAALISAVCGITYTLFAGKGKVYCYYIGLTGTLFYCYISYKNGFYGNMALYGLYFLPMQIIGIFKWKKNINTQKNEIYKTKLSQKERIIYTLITLFMTVFIYFIIKTNGGKSPLADSVITSFSILGQFLTVKRCIEQWYVWFIVNLTAVIMWASACINGAGYIATLIMWCVYLILAVYFLKKWDKEIKK